MKYKYKYYFYIPSVFIIGFMFMIWGIGLLSDALENKKHLGNVYDENVDVTKLKEHNYISTDKVKFLGGTIKSTGKYSEFGHIWLSGTSTENYYSVNINGNEKQYISLMIKEALSKELNLEFDENGYLKSWNNDDLFKDGFEFMVVEVNNTHKDSIKSAKEYLESPKYDGDFNMPDKDEIGFYEEIALVVVDFNKEKELMTAACSILLYAIFIMIASKPWKFVEKKYVPILDFNLAYKEEKDENDMAIIAEVARSLRLDIKYYEGDLDIIKVHIKKTFIAILISTGVEFLMGCFIYIQDKDIGLVILTLGITVFIPVVLIFKLLVNVIKYVLNQDIPFVRKVMKTFDKEPLMCLINERKEKLAKCDEILKENLYNREDLLRM